MERKVKDLPSIFINNIQHSGSYFFISRFYALSYANLNISSFPYLRPEKFAQFSEGGYLAQDHLQFNEYNACRMKELLNSAKILIHFRDPRSVLVSSIHHMYKKLSPIEVHTESLKLNTEPIPVDFIDWTFKKKLQFLIDYYYDIQYARFVNSWHEFSKCLNSNQRRNFLITEYSELRNSGQKF